MKIDQEKLETMNNLRAKIAEQIRETGDASEEDRKALTVLVEETGYCDEIGTLEDNDL